MWWWLRRICGGGGAGYVVGEIKNKANSAQLELELGLSLAIIVIFVFSGSLPAVGGWGTVRRNDWRSLPAMLGDGIVDRSSLF
jgi:hypothetical protein